ncbi:MAG TPA: RagB/SusD family nutrient uptake outer membrane protein [Chryseolinea sp.]|nr:RagB/SusD family nutrient uptake outer membrane protein [Chryseolinea sp.]
MKRYIKYFLITALTISFSACKEEFLEFVPEDQATVDAWYRNENEIRQSTASLYGRPWFGFNDEFGWLAGDLMAGDMHHNWDQEGQFFYLSYNENNSYIGDGWQGLYDVISYANLIIDDMPVIAGRYGVSEGIINAGLAEARFMRGMAYFLLTEYWGEAPIIEKPAAKIASGNLQLPKNTTASLYEFARRDLVFAAEYLPPADDAGRVTSWAAKGMLAKLHVTLGQRSVGGTMGSAADFATAASYAADVINNSGLSLFANYEDMFKIDNEHNPEILFALQWINGGYGFGNSRQARFARHSRVTGDSQAWGGGKCMTESFLTTIKDNAGSEIDKRRRAIYMQVGDVYDYLATAEGGYEYDIVSRDDKGNQVEGSTPTLTSLKKYVVGSAADHGYVISNQDSPLDIYMLRLSDVYLLYTEALMGSSSTLADGAGLASYNAVRERAGLDTRTSVSYIQLFNERRVEFALEGLSWLDVKRRYYRNSEEAIAYLNSQGRTDRYYRINTNDGLENDPAGYELVAAGQTSANGNQNTDPVVSFNATKMALPIPGSEMVSNPLLKEEAVEYEFQ